MFEIFSLSLPPSKYRSPLSDARSKGLRNEVINAPRFPRAVAASPVFRGVLCGLMQITVDISDGRVWRLSGEVMIGDIRLSIMRFWPIKLGA